MRDRPAGITASDAPRAHARTLAAPEPQDPEAGRPTSYAEATAAPGAAAGRLGGARDRRAVTAERSRWVRMRSITGGSVMISFAANPEDPAEDVAETQHQEFDLHSVPEREEPDVALGDAAREVRCPAIAR